MRTACSAVLGAFCHGGVCDDALHEVLCRVGSGSIACHSCVREWLGERLRDAFGGMSYAAAARAHLKHAGAAGQ